MPIRRHRTPTEASRQPTSRRQRVAVVLAAAIALIVVAALIGQGTTSSSSSSSKKESTTDLSMRSTSPPTAEASIGSAAPSTTAPGGASAASTASSDRDATASKAAAASGRGGQLGAPVGPKVVRTGSIEVEVGRHRFGGASSRLQVIATGAGGFVSVSETASLDGDPHGSITLRVPVASFDSVLDRVAKLGTVRASTTGSQDVTGEYADVAARIRALEAERDQIGLVLAKAESINDILAVRDRLSTVQGELEQLQGRQQVLDDQTSLSTLTVALTEKGATPIGIDRPAERRGLAKVWHQSIDRIGDGGGAIALGLASMVPWLLLALVLWLPARALWRRLVATPASVASPGTTTGPAAPPPSVTAAD